LHSGHLKLHLPAAIGRAVVGKMNKIAHYPVKVPPSAVYSIVALPRQLKLIAARLKTKS
jgi:hypothetical protein